MKPLTVGLACAALCGGASAATRGPEAPVLAFFDAPWNRGDFSGLSSEFTTPTAVLHFRGRDIVLSEAGTRGVVQTWRRGFPDFHFQVEDVVVQGDKVALRLTFTGIQTGPFMGAPPSGRPIKVSETVIARVVNGRISDIWEDYDELGMRQQLGLLPAGAPPPARPTNP
jgi:predicted ester cyclase